MSKSTPWIAGLCLVAAGFITWSALGARREERPSAQAREDEVRARREEPPPPVAGLRTPEDQPGALPPAVDVPPEEPASTPLALELQRVAESFLTDEPRVAELLALSQELARQALVERASLEVVRDDEGALRSVRAELSAGALRGTFLFDDGTYHVRLQAASGEPPWSRADLLISFEERELHAAGCHATLQFQPASEEPASRHLAAGEERLVGWSLGMTPEHGTLARPLAVGALGDVWQVGNGADHAPRELPWIANTSSFEAWLNTLRPFVVE